MGWPSAASFQPVRLALAAAPPRFAALAPSHDCSPEDQQLRVRPPFSRSFYDLPPLAPYRPPPSGQGTVMLCAFGLPPRPHSDDPFRAVRAART
eukprot:6019866-Pleurochrysis_carterae.AAC.1